MNLNKGPSREQLVNLLRSCDDSAGDHIVWVDKYGTVHSSMLPDTLRPTGFEEAYPSLQFRYETYIQDNGYVGNSAADDDDWVDQMFANLQEDWKNQHSGLLRYD